MNRRATSRRGMTSLEVLCATLLATLLMTAVLGVVSGLAKRERTLNKRRPEPAWMRQLASQLSGEFASASEVRMLADGFVLRGPFGRDAKTGVADWRDAEIAYQIVEVDADEVGSALIRTERDALVTSDKSLSEVVCFGADRLSLTAGPPLPQPLPEGGNLIETDLGSGPLPTSLYFVMRSSGKSFPPLQLRLIRP